MEPDSDDDSGADDVVEYDNVTLTDSTDGAQYVCAWCMVNYTDGRALLAPGFVPPNHEPFVRRYRVQLSNARGDTATLADAVLGPEAGGHPLGIESFTVESRNPPPLSDSTDSDDMDVFAGPPPLGQWEEESSDLSEDYFEFAEGVLRVRARATGGGEHGLQEPEREIAIRDLVLNFRRTNGVFQMPGDAPLAVDPEKDAFKIIAKSSEGDVHLKDVVLDLSRKPGDDYSIRYFAVDTGDDQGDDMFDSGDDFSDFSDAMDSREFDDSHDPSDYGSGSDES